MDTGVSDTWIYPGISGDRTGENGILEKSGIYAGSDHTFVLSFVEGWIVLTGMAVAMAAGFMNAVNGFLYLYSRKKTDFYHSLPMKRSELFAEKAVMGLIYYLVPYIVHRISDSLCWGRLNGGLFESRP